MASGSRSVLTASSRIYIFEVFCDGRILCIYKNTQYNNPISKAISRSRYSPTNRLCSTRTIWLNATNVKAKDGNQYAAATAKAKSKSKTLAPNAQNLPEGYLAKAVGMNGGAPVDDVRIEDTSLAIPVEVQEREVSRPVHSVTRPETVRNAGNVIIVKVEVLVLSLPTEELRTVQSKERSVS